MEKAYERSYGKNLPENMLVYDLQLYDNSNIPLTKLGKQLLTVTVPVPDSLKGEGIQIYTIDRNGQLELVSGEVLLVDGMESVRFAVKHLSLFGLCGNGEAYDSSQLMEETTRIESMGAPPSSGTEVWPMAKYLTGIAVLLGGIVLLFMRTKKNKGN